MVVNYIVIIIVIYIVIFTTNNIIIRTAKIADVTYPIDSYEYIKINYLGKAFQTRSYWEGNSLVVHR